MVWRLVTGILAGVFLPLGVVFLTIGLTADEIDRGTPEGMAYAGAGIAAAGVILAAAFLVLWRKEAARRRRRREGLRATAEIVEAKWMTNVRSGSTIGLRLTVRIPAAGTVTSTVLAPITPQWVAGAPIEVAYDPSDPSNFEPVG